MIGPTNCFFSVHFVQSIYGFPSFRFSSLCLYLLIRNKIIRFEIVQPCSVSSEVQNKSFGRSVRHLCSAFIIVDNCLIIFNLEKVGTRKDGYFGQKKVHIIIMFSLQSKK